MAITKYKLETKGKHKGWWLGQYSEFRQASGKPSRVRLFHVNEPAFKSLSKKDQNDQLEAKWESIRDKKREERDHVENPFEKSETEAGRHTIAETIQKFTEVRMPLLKLGTQKSFTRHLAYWKSRIGDLTWKDWIGNV